MEEGYMGYRGITGNNVKKQQRKTTRAQNGKNPVGKMARSIHPHPLWYSPTQ
jgi:hypothetical protein